jgi:hypothetical protein
MGITISEDILNMEDEDRDISQVPIEFYEVAVQIYNRYAEFGGVLEADIVGEHHDNIDFINYDGNYYNNSNANNNNNNGNLNRNNWNVNNNNGNNNANILRNNSLPEGVVRPARCFDPIMGNNANITPDADMTYFYVMNAGGTAISSVGCLDPESLQQYKTRIEYVFYKCKETVPNGALHIRRENVEPTPYRLMNFSQRVYIADRDAKRIVPGGSYILKPIGPIGRIASKRVVNGGDVVGALHCGPADPGNIIFSVQKMVERVATGGSRKRRKTRKQKRSRKNRKTRKW